MFKTSIDNVTKQRPCRPLYAMTQATPQAFTLDPTCTVDFVPGTVMSIANVSMTDDVDGTRLTPSMYAGVTPTVTVCVGDMVPYGLSAAWAGGVSDEVRMDGTNGIGVWVGGKDAQFSLLAEAFDATTVELQDAATRLAAGEIVHLGPDANGMVTFVDSTVDATYGGVTVQEANPKAFLKLINIVSPGEITVSFV